MIRKDEVLLMFHWIWACLIILIPIQLPFLELKNVLLLPFWNFIIQDGLGKQLPIFSDSQGFVIVLIMSLFLSLVSFLFVLKWIRKHLDTVMKILNYTLLASVFIIFIKYGLDKVMMLQFPRPEPNLLYTELKDFDKDLLFWTTMGTSTMYNYISGGIEILGAVLLLFHRTRRLGLMLLLLSASYIVLLNFSFNIGVKFFSLLLLGTLITLNWNTLSFLYQYLLGFSEEKNRPIPVKLYIPILKGILAISTLFYLIEMNQQNTHHNEFMGSYRLFDTNNSSYIFINQQNYWIEKDKNNTIKAYQIIQQGEKALRLQGDFGEEKLVLFSKNKETNYTLTDEKGNNFIYKKLRTNVYPVYQDRMNLVVK